MATFEAGEGGSTGEPLVGRGTARPRDDGGPRSSSDPSQPVTRAGAPERSVPRPPLRAPRGGPWPRAGVRIRNPRLALGLALVVLLAGAWAAVGGAPTSPGIREPRASRSRPSAAPRSKPAPPVTTAPATTVPAAVAVPRWVPAAIAATCRAHVVAGPAFVVDCTPGRGVDHLRYRSYASATELRAAYDANGSHRGGAGPPACATGQPEERTWSRAAAPARPLGRYRCSLDAGRARLVWTSARTRVIAVATRVDADLRSLYEWWTSVPGPNGS